MQEIIEWLQKIEKLAGNIYSRASRFFETDKNLSRFLKQFSDDEASHHHIISIAMENISILSNQETAVILDDATKQKIESVFGRIDQRLENKQLTEELLLEEMIYVETTEWNDIFLYIANTMKEKVPNFDPFAIQIQNHKRKLELFCENRPGLKKKISQLKSLSPVWQDNLLIVEDNSAVSAFLKAVFKGEGNVDIAENGQAALDKLKQNYYKLIISDIDMPVMDGIEFFSHAKKIYPDIRKRFLFFSGHVSADRRSFLEENRLPFLTKPAPMDQLRQHAMEILLLDDLSN